MGHRSIVPTDHLLQMDGPKKKKGREEIVRVMNASMDVREGEGESRSAYYARTARLLLLVVLEATYHYRLMASTDSDSATGSDRCDYHCLFVELF